MKTNSDTTRTLYLGLDVHKEQTVIAILEGDRDAAPRDYGNVKVMAHPLAGANVDRVVGVEIRWKHRKQRG